MRGKKESQKQKRIVDRQEKANTMLNKAVSSGNLKKEERGIKKVKKLQTKYKDAGDAKRKVFKTNENGVKQRQVSKNGVVKKTVTRTKGGVEKEIERGNKRIDVRKYKDEGVKTRTVTNMKKNNSSDLKQNSNTGKMSIKGTPVKDLVKNSAFKNIPSSMVKDAAKPENNVLPANRMDKVMQRANKAFISAATKYAKKQRKENK